MSGHSHFKTVKATKDANDAKKGKIFSKFARLIALAAKQKGGDPSTNLTLKAAIEQARTFNMPKENIERAIKKGTGELQGEQLEEILIEGFGPGGIALILEGITDNKNRTIGEVRNILSKYEGKMASEGAVSWMFSRRGVIEVETPAEADRESLELTAIESGAQDVQWNGQMLEIYTEPEQLETVKKALEEKNILAASANLSWIPKEEISPTDRERELTKKLSEAIDENDDIQDIYSNLKD
ncbi:MAG: YebC/PmpR family DNA-binding transcriptional regulator [Candidatus Saccharimonadales bacterium]